MIITTTHSVEGRQITEYLGVVSAESVHGINVVRDFFTGVRDFFGGRSQTLERALKKRVPRSRMKSATGRGTCGQMPLSGWISKSACLLVVAGCWWCLPPGRQCAWAEIRQP